MQQFPKKESSPDFSNPKVQEAFVQDTEEHKVLMQKELSVNQAEQVLLKQRIELMSSFVNDIPSHDPQYSMLRLQVQMDRLELDELKIREVLLTQRLSWE